MISKQNLLELFNQEVIFLGFTDEDNFKTSNIKSRTDWHGNQYIYRNENNHFQSPYHNKIGIVEGQNDDGSIRVSFPQCNFQGEILNDERAEMSFEFRDNSQGLIDYDPIFVNVNYNL